MNDGINTGHPADDIARDICILYGIGLHNSDWLLSASTGIEYIDKVWASNPPSNALPITSTSPATIHSSAIGLPYQFQILYSLSKVLGFGIVMFGDVNAVFSHVGGMFAIEFGDL
jgi:hypothetical protein